MITNIRLQNFRSYQDASFEFEPGVNVIVGPNASGKTNIIEAILVAARGKSYRARDDELIKHQAPWARIDADFGDKHRTVKLEKQAASVKKSFALDDKVILRLSSNNRLPVVLFEPDHLLMLGGSPELRRLFLDLLIEQTDHQYGSILSNYKRTLLQRNKLLKTSQQAPPSQLFAWDIRLSELGEQVVVARHQMIAQINQQITTVYNELARQPDKIELTYGCTVNPASYGSYLLKQLEKDRQLDLLRGFTGAGPHREDIIFKLNQQLLANTASRGEHRTTLLALKIIELRLLEAQTNQKPLVLLDDVFSELDGSRRTALTAFMKDYQIFITTTDADVITHRFTQKANVITTQV